MGVRYIRTIMPLEHINGKLAPVRVKCPDSMSEEDVYTDGFFYGYSTKYSDVNYFAVRTKCRNLTKTPVTQAERANRTLFTNALEAVFEAMQDERKRNLCKADFEKQTRYRTIRGFAVAVTRENGGVWPSFWEP